MIDIHTHLLFGVDDGCRTLEDSIEMIEAAVSHEITEIILTPHYSYLRKYTKNKKIIEDNFIILKDEVKKRNINMNLYLGSEIDETDDIFDFLENQKCHTMNNTKYVLIDFGMKKCNIDEYCYELIVKGYKPIIAHPERYRYITDINEYRKWKKTGALIQINANNIFNSNSSQTKKMARLACKNRLVDFIASDAHKDPKRFEYLQKAYLYGLKKSDKENIDKLFFSNSKKIIMNS